MRQIPSERRLRNYLAATVPDLDYTKPASDRFLELASRSLGLLLDSAGVAGDDPRLVTIIGTSFGDLLDRAEDPCGFAAWTRAIRRCLNLKQEPLVVSTACSSGSDALALGLMLVRSGAAELCACGGVDILTDVKRLGHSSLGTLSPTRLRAFDQEHDGTLLGEGAAFVLLEREGRPEARPLGYVLGHGAAHDCSSMTAPDRDGTAMALSLRRGLADAGLRPDDLCCYCAHGTGTVAGDLSEAAAVQSVFQGISGLKVFATKGNLGHPLGAAGAIEAVALLMALRTRQAPPLVWSENIVPEMAGRVSTREPVELEGSLGASVTLGFGGCTTCLIMGGPSCRPA